MTRRKMRWLALLGGAAVVAALRVGPSLRGATGLIVSFLTLLVLVGLGYLSFAVAAAWWGRGRASIALLVAAAGPVVVTGVQWSGGWGTRMPCRRNWGWLPSYLLRTSPTRSVRFEVGNVRAKLCYGQPAAKGRTMIGSGIVPFGRLWRTGANEPTTLKAAGPISVAGIRVADGLAAIYTVPGQETWQIVVTGSTGQWGIESLYTDAVRAEELGRASARSEPSNSYHERLLFSAEPIGGDTVGLVLRWERTKITIPIWPAE